MRLTAHWICLPEKATCDSPNTRRPTRIHAARALVFFAGFKSIWPRLPVRCAPLMQVAPGLSEIQFGFTAFYAAYTIFEMDG
jgi:hypothetical protein